MTILFPPPSSLEIFCIFVLFKNICLLYSLNTSELFGIEIRAVDGRQKENWNELS